MDQVQKSVCVSVYVHVHFFEMRQGFRVLKSYSFGMDGYKLSGCIQIHFSTCFICIKMRKNKEKETEFGASNCSKGRCVRT